jgi:membrane protein CcdC involved in cytochrome C biogenesis
MDPGHKAEPEPSSPRGVAFWAGIGLMVASFSAFAFYLVIPFLPVSVETMTNLLVIGVIVSWGLFLLGTFLAGKEGYLYLKRRVGNWFRKS